MIQKKSSWVLVVAALAALGVGTLAAGPSGGAESIFVTPAWLAEHIHDAGLVLIHVGDKNDYEKQHIPGAQYLSIRDISTPMGEGLTLQMPAAAQLKEAFEKAGVSDRSRVVVYFAKDGTMTPAARVVLTLQYMGLSSQASLLSGGMPAWQKQGGAMTADPSPSAHGSLTPHVREDVVTDITWVSSHLKQPGVAIVDARTPNYYSGKDAGRMPRAGHIPGAVNIPFNTVVDGSSSMKSQAELETLFRAAGVKPGQTVVTYCHIGQQASLLYLAARSLGYDARMYDGSWEEWSSRKDLPAEKSGDAGN